MGTAETGDEAFEGTIEVVRGRLGDDLAEQLVAFWTGRGLLDAAAARDRLPEVVCLALDEAGEIVGVNSVFAENVQLIGGRRFWIYRTFLVPAAQMAGPAMIRAAYEALGTEFDPDGDDPLGLCILISDPAEMRRRPEAEWTDPRIIYAGYLADGRQVRIGYFDGAKVYEGLPGA